MTSSSSTRPGQSPSFHANAPVSSTRERAADRAVFSRADRRRSHRCARERVGPDRGLCCLAGRRAGSARHRRGGGHREDDALASGLRALEENGFRVLSATPAASERSSRCRRSPMCSRTCSPRCDPCFPRPSGAIRGGAGGVGVGRSGHVVRAGAALRPAACSRALAQGQPVALGIDNCQWLDAASAAAFMYALRRLDGEPVRCLFAVRAGEASHFDLGQLGTLPVDVLEVGPLSVGATQRLLVDELGVSYPRRVIRRLVETSGRESVLRARALPRARTRSRRARRWCARPVAASGRARLGPARQCLGALAEAPRSRQPLTVGHDPSTRPP